METSHPHSVEHVAYTNRPPSAWAPLRRPLFRALWIATVVSNIGTWMHEVGASWLMTSLAPSPLMVALVQAATSLPMVFLALPAGALADVVDRRRYLIVTQLWMLVTAALLGTCTWIGMTNAWLLLGFTFALGCGAAMTMPAWAAIAPDLVPREELQAAVTLNGLGMNVARAIGPALAGLIVAAFGPATVFLLNAVSFLGVLAVLFRWRRIPRESTLPAERLFGAMRAGLRYARHSKMLQAVLMRAAAFFLFASAPWALLPLLVRQEIGGGPDVYGLFLTAIGAGAVVTAFFLPRIRTKLSCGALVALATIIYAVAALMLAQVRNVYALDAVMFAMGAGWITVMSSLQVAAQAALPGWVRARGLACFMVIFMGGMAGGSVLWGQVATIVGMPQALIAAAVGALFGVALTWRIRLGGHEGVELVPSMHWPAPLVAKDPEMDQGPVMIQLEYRVDATHTERFLSLMQAYREMRRRDGAFFWELFRDTADPSRFIECFMVESWLEHLRQHERVTVADRTIQEELKRCLLGEDYPRVSPTILRSLSLALRAAEWDVRLNLPIADQKRRTNRVIPTPTRLSASCALCVGGMVATVANAALAVSPEGPPKYQKLRYEDYRYLQDPSKRIDWFDPIKHVPLSEDGDNYLSFGGLIRERYE